MGMTKAEYEVLLEGVDDFKKVLPMDRPDKMPEPETLIERTFDTEKIMPYTATALRREGFTQLAAKYQGEGLENLVNAIPAAKKLLDAKFRTSMKGRLPWAERKKLYEQFSKATDIKEKWSLLHPFDDLTGEEMKAAVVGAEKAKARGLGAVSVTERALILRAGAIDFFASLIPKE